LCASFVSKTKKETITVFKNTGGHYFQQQQQQQQQEQNRKQMNSVGSKSLKLKCGKTNKNLQKIVLVWFFEVRCVSLTNYDSALSI